MSKFKNYIKRKSKVSLVIDSLIAIMLILLAIPATRSDMAALILRPTLFIHQPSVKSNKIPLSDNAYKWKLKDNTGEVVNFKEFDGKVIFINFWGTWCAPCVAEMGGLQKLYNDYGDKVEFLFVSNESMSTLNAFSEKKGYTLPMYVPLTQYPHDFESNSVPTTFIISKKGEIVVDKKGVANWNSQRVRGVLDALINSK